MASVPDLHTNVLLRSERSGGHVSMIENVVSAHSAGPTLHTHDFDEASYMLEGELIFQIRDACWGTTSERPRRPTTRYRNARS